jgi:hypothetical protein
MHYKRHNRHQINTTAVGAVLQQGPVLIEAAIWLDAVIARDGEDDHRPQLGERAGQHGRVARNHSAVDGNLEAGDRVFAGVAAVGARKDGQGLLLRRWRQKAILHDHQRIALRY